MSTTAEILQEMIAAVSEKYEKQPGSFIYDALAPAAERFEGMDKLLEAAKEKLSIENLSGDELAQRIKERTGIERKEATRSIGIVTVTGTGTIRVGDLFETSGGIQFLSVETKNIAVSGMVKVEAVEAGASGNVPANTITLFPVTLTGFTAVTNSSPSKDGFDAESDTDLLQRYYDHIRTPATSGNKAHYKNWAKEVPGVGDARVIPLWSGDNTVKVVIIDSDKRPASNAIVKAVQDHIDPGVTGTGEGEAPLGAFAKVISATGVVINVSVTIALSDGYSVQQARDNILVSMVRYLKEIAFVESIVSYAKIGAAILDSEGVEDYTSLRVNNGTTNISIQNEQVAIPGPVAVDV